MTEPMIIQGGMGVAVSNWRLARAVSRAGQLGVVSGTALENVLARRLQLGDLDGSMRFGFGPFPNAAIARRILDRYYIPGGKEEGRPLRIRYVAFPCSPEVVELTVAANRRGFPRESRPRWPGGGQLLGKNSASDPFLALRGAVGRSGLCPDGSGNSPFHTGPIGSTGFKSVVEDQQFMEQPRKTRYHISFDPREILESPGASLKRPSFIAIVSSEVLAIAEQKSPREGRWVCH